MSAATATDTHSVHAQEGKHETILVHGRRLNVVGRLGEGAYSIVYLVQDPDGKHANKRYALKRLAVQREEDLPKLVEEMERTERLSHHPFICACYGFEISRVEGKHYAVMLLQHGGTPLVNIMKERQGRGECGLGQADTLRMAFQIGSAISFMHHQEPFPVAHRDLKAENVMESRGVFRLVDFGSATTCCFDPKTAKDFIRVQNEVSGSTTLAYRAPEMCDVYRKHRIDQQVDVWALGVLLYYVMYFQFPFEETSLSILKGNITFPEEPRYDAALVEAVRRCLTQNPSERWTVDGFLQFLGEAFPQEEQLVKGIMESMEDEEDPQLIKPVGTGQTGVKLIAAGEIGVQPRATICTGEEDGEPAWMKEEGGESGDHQQQQQQAANNSNEAGQPKKGALFSKLKWNAGSPTAMGAASSSGGSFASQPSSPQPQQQQQQNQAKPQSSNIDDLFAGGGRASAPVTASNAGAFDPFGTGPVVSPQQQQQRSPQQQARGPAVAPATVSNTNTSSGNCDLFINAPPPPPGPKMNLAAAPPPQKKDDPFSTLFK